MAQLQGWATPSPKPKQKEIRLWAGSCLSAKDRGGKVILEPGGSDPKLWADSCCRKCSVWEQKLPADAGKHG